MMTHFQASTEKTLLNEDATVAEETDASDVMAGQQRSGDQISILRQAASILHIPITDLPAALIARESPPSVAKTDAEDSGLPFVEHSGSETNETHHIPLWPWDNLNWDFDALSELEQAPEHRLSTTHFEANINSLYQGLILPELWHQDSSEALQSILPLDPDSSLRNPELQPDYDSSIALGLSEPAGGSNLVAENTGVLPDLIRIGSQHINFGDVFDMNAYSGSGQHSSMYAHTALLESTFDAAEAFPGPNGSMNALPIPVPMSGESDEVYGSPRNDDLQLVDKLHTLQPPYMPSGSDVPVLGNSSSSTSSSSWVITTPSPEKEKSPESNSISSNQGIARGLAASGPCRYIWELRTRVRD
jgi:hypothetical protein